MKRTTIFLPDKLHEDLRTEAFSQHISMAELIRLRLEPARKPLKKKVDPLAEVEGIAGGDLNGELLSADLDEALYGE